MSNNWKWMKVGLIVLLAAMLVVVGCSNQSGNDPVASNTPEPAATGENPGTGTEELPRVELTYYFLQSSMQTDYKNVEDAINEYLVPRINATVRLFPILQGNYTDKMNTVIAAGEQFDLAFTSSWAFPFDNAVSQGAFVPMNDLLETFAPDFYNSLPATVWEDISIDGQIYAIPNYQISASAIGFYVQKRFADKYNLDINSIRSYEDLEPFLEQIKQNESGIIPITNVGFYPQLYGYVSRDNTVMKIGDPEYKLLNKFAIPEFMEYTKLMHDWYKKGYINADAAMTASNWVELTSTGTVAVIPNTTMKPGGETDIKTSFGGQDVIGITVTEPQYTGVKGTLTAISRTSRNPERAMMFLNLVNTDPVMYNLLAYGIEGKHYDKIGGNMIRIIEDGGYNTNVPWAMGNETIGYLREGMPEDTYKVTLEMNNSARPSPLYGFSFKRDNVLTEIANINAAREQFVVALATGSVDPEVYIPQLLDAWDKAGIDRFIAEEQKQLDEWLVEKGLK